MRRCAKTDGGFLLSFVLNLCLRGEWLLCSLILLALHYLLDLPLFLTWIALGIWVLISFGITCLLQWASDTSQSAPTYGGQRTSERLKKQQEEARRAEALQNTGSSSDA